MSPQPSRKPWYRILYVQVLIAVALGVVVGACFPDSAKDKWHASSLKPLGDAFVNLVKMLIGPIIFNLSFAWVVFFGATACVKYKLHPSIDMLVVRLPRPLQWCVRWLNHCLLLGFCAFMTWFGTRFAIDSWSNPSPVLRLPLTWLYGPVAFCFALMAVRYVQVLRHGPWQIDGERETHVG